MIASVDPLHDIHASDDSSKRSKPLSVFVALSAKIERRLIADADEERGSCARSNRIAREVVP
jgi:hypothetical protein